MTTQTHPKTRIPAYDRAEVTAFFASLDPDPDRDRLMHNLRVAEQDVTATLTRKAEIATRLDRIATGLIGATAKDRARLVAERGELVSERALVPQTLRIVAGRYATALVAWARHVRPQVATAHNAAVDAVNATGQRRQELAQHLGQLESESRYADQALPRRAELQAIAQANAPHIARRDDARQVISFIDIEMVRRFGDTVRNGSVGEVEIARFVDGVAGRAA